MLKLKNGGDDLNACPRHRIEFNVEPLQQIAYYDEEDCAANRSAPQGDSFVALQLRQSRFHRPIRKFGGDRLSSLLED